MIIGRHALRAAAPRAGAFSAISRLAGLPSQACFGTGAARLQSFDSSRPADASEALSTGDSVAAPGNEAGPELETASNGTRRPQPPRRSSFRSAPPPKSSPPATSTASTPSATSTASTPSATSTASTPPATSTASSPPATSTASSPPAKSTASSPPAKSTAKSPVKPPAKPSAKSPATSPATSPGTPAKLPASFAADFDFKGLPKALAKDEPLTPAERMTSASADWATSFHGISSKPASAAQYQRLMTPLEVSEIEVKPDGIIYLPEIKYRRRLNAAFGPMGWGMIPRGEPVVGSNIVTREYALIVSGRFVAQAQGENQFFSLEQLPSAVEGCKSNALMRCCKDLGIASELWDPAYIRWFRKTYMESHWVEHQTTKKKRQMWFRKGDVDVAYPYKLTK